MTTTVTTATTATVTALQERLDDYWSGRAADYHAHQVSGPRAALDRALWSQVFGTRLGDAADATDVLDVGTGSGYLANLLAADGFRVTGIDHAPGMVDAAVAAAHPSATFRLGDAHAPDVADRSVDAVVSRYVLWTLPDPVAAAVAWRRALRPGGVVVAVDASWFPDGVDPSMKVPSADGEDAFVQTYDPATLAALPLGTAGTSAFAKVFRAAGFDSVTVEELPEVAELDQRFGVAPGHESRPHVVVTAQA